VSHFASSSHNNVTTSGGRWRFKSSSSGLRCRVVTW